MSVFNALNYNNEVFRVYITWGGFLIIKMVLMSLLTGAQRFRKGVRIEALTVLTFLKSILTT